MKMRCLVVEDEPLAQEVLVRFIGDMPDLELAGICADAIEARSALGKKETDLIFLDINLPKISGISFLKTLKDPPMIIFTTAYPEYAVEGFEVEAVDYLVKPILFDRFIKAVTKAQERMIYLRQRPGDTGKETHKEFIVLRSDKKLYRINIPDIKYLESMGDYVKVHCHEKTLIVHETFRNLEKLLLPHDFIRIHKSFIIPLRIVQYLDGNEVMISGRKFPVGQVYKENLLKRLNS
jgi:DNA-binding LytR/AlgR family response regulator